MAAEYRVQLDRSNDTTLRLIDGKRNLLEFIMKLKKTNSLKHALGRKCFTNTIEGKIKKSQLGKRNITIIYNLKQGNSYCRFKTMYKTEAAR